MKELREILEPIDAYLQGRYNQWRLQHPRGLSLVKATEALHQRMQKDNCELCHGEKGGVLGNENVIEGRIVCDYCSVLTHDSRIESHGAQ
jgi:hypothetical protein